MAHKELSIRVDKQLAHMSVLGVSAYRYKEMVRIAKKHGLWYEGAELTSIDIGVVTERFGESYLAILNEGWGNSKYGVEFTVVENDQIALRSPVPA